MPRHIPPCLLSSKGLFSTAGPGLLFALMLVAAGCGRPASSGDSPAGSTAGAMAAIGVDNPPGAVGPVGGEVAVSNPLLAVACREWLGPDSPLLLLAEPGMCPGHFDLRPSQVRRLRDCRLLLRFDFQRWLDDRFASAGPGGRVVPVSVLGGMCEPASFELVCQQVGGALIEQGLLTDERFDRQQREIARRMDRLHRWAREQVDGAGLVGRPVLASDHQAGFCAALGLDVVATFSAADSTTPGRVDAAIRSAERQGARLIVANRPEGRQLADALADRLRGRVVVFANFPDGEQPGAFDTLVRHNVGALVEASRKLAGSEREGSSLAADQAEASAR